VVPPKALFWTPGILLLSILEECFMAIEHALQGKRRQGSLLLGIAATCPEKASMISTYLFGNPVRREAAL
jgi:hypothetical protein